MPTLQRVFFALAYLTGRAPWDTGVSPPELVEVIEGPSPLPPGRALDIGCGTGTNSVYMARSGWSVTGVDFAGRALAAAHRKAAAAGIGVTFIRGDATRLGDLGLEPGFDLLLDVGCFHGVPAAGRPAYVAGAAGLARAGATLLLYCFRKRRALVPPTVSDAEVREVFDPAFEVVRVRPGEGDLDPAWYTMRRRSSPGAETL